MRMIGRANQSESFGTLDKRETKVGGSAKIVYAILTGMVSDKIAYPIREYCTNAWEVSPSGKPFEVTLPTVHTPVFGVRDYGPGLSHRFMMNRFPVLGDSTKDESDDTPGGWGFGAKSGLAYLMREEGCGSFTVVSRHKGIRRSYIIGLSEKGQIQVECLEEDEDTGPSGLEVIFPVEIADINVFHDRAKRILWSFEPRPVISVEMCWPEAEVRARGTGWTLYNRDTVPWSGPHVRIGPVMYPLTLSHLEKNGFITSYDAVLFEARIGSLSVSASREALAYDDKTRNALNALIADYEMSFALELQKDIDVAEDYFSACKVFYDKSLSLGTDRTGFLRQKVSWRGLPFRMYVSIDTSKVKTNCLSRGWVSFDRFEHCELNNSAVVGARVVVEHAPYRSFEKMQIAGLVGQPVLWLRVRRTYKEEVLASLGNPDHIVLDDVKLNSPGVKRHATKRIRPVISFSRQVDGNIHKNLVDLVDGEGLYVERSSQTRGGYKIGNNLNTTLSGLGSIIREMKSMHFDIPDQVLIPNRDDIMGSGWIEVGAFLKVKLEDRFDPTDICPYQRNALMHVPSGASMMGRFREHFADAPDDVRIFAEESHRIYKEITDKEKPSENSSIKSLLMRLGVKIESYAKGPNPSDYLTKGYAELCKKYILLGRLITNVGYYSYEKDRLRELKHYFELLKYYNPTPEREVMPEDTPDDDDVLDDWATLEAAE